MTEPRRHLRDIAARWSFLQQGCWLAAAACGVLLLQRLVFGPRTVGALGTMGVSAILFAFAPAAASLHRTLAVHGLLVALAVLVGIDAWFLGGIRAPSSLALLVLPSLASFSLGHRAGIAHAGVGIAVLGGLYLAPLVLPPEPLLTGSVALVTHTSAVVAMLGFLAGLSTLYDRERTRRAARTAAMIEHLGEGVLAVDAKGEIQVDNPQVRQLMGDALPRAVQSLVGQALARTRPTEGQIHLEGGRVIEVSAAPVPGDTGTVVTTLRDITDDLEADRSATDFIRDVAVELRGPLASVLGFARVSQKKVRRRVFPRLPEGEPTVDRARRRIEQNLEIVIEEGRRLGGLVDELLDIASMEAGEVKWHLETVDVPALIERTVDATHGLFLDRPVTLQASVEEGVSSVVADRQRLLQVLVNLVSNASKFTEEGEVRLDVGLDGDDMFIEVSDTGSGIALEHQQTIFERFRQAPSGHGQGTGLGLPICRQIIEGHGGSIEVESEVGMGSTFRIELPGNAPEQA